MRKMFLMAALSILLLVTGTGCEKETDLSEPTPPIRKIIR